MWIIAGGVKLGIGTTLRDQLAAAAAFDDPAVLENNNLIDVMNRPEPMSDDECCSSMHQFLDRFHDGRFGGGIEGGGRLIE